MEKCVKGIMIEQRVTQEDNISCSITIANGYNSIHDILEEHVPTCLLDDSRIEDILDKVTKFIINNMIESDRHDDTFIEDGIMFMYELIENVDKPKNKYYLEVSSEDISLIENSLNSMTIENKIYNDPVDLAIKTIINDVHEQTEFDVHDCYDWVVDAINNDIDSRITEYLAELNN